MSVGSERDLEGLRRAGRVVALALKAMRAAVRAGITTAELDDIAARILAEHGARSAPRLAYAFPGTTCISINEEAVHGIPGPRRLEPGDLVTLDVTVELDGYYADAAVTVGVPPMADEARRLVASAEAAWAAGARAARAGARLRDIGAAVEREVERRGFRVLRELCGHGIGRAIHEDPEVVNFFAPGAKERVTEGLVLALEPIVCAGTRECRDTSDGWTVASADGSLTAHYEHTIVVGKGAPLVLTAA